MSKPQRNALVILVILLLCVSYLKDFSLKSTPVPLDKAVMEYHKKAIDSMAKSKAKIPDLYPFNPNYLTDYRAYVLGLKPTSIDQLLNHRKSGKWMNNAAQFQSVAGIDDSLMALLKPYLIFPRIKKNKDVKNTKPKKRGLNQCDAVALQSVYGVGKKRSQRIIKYRSLLKGFSEMDQLYEVYGLYSSVVDRIKKKFEIQVLPKIDRMVLDSISYQDLVGLPYITPSDAQKIIRRRTAQEGISFDDLKNIEGFDSLKIARISLYLRRF